MENKRKALEVRIAKLESNGKNIDSNGVLKKLYRKLNKLG